jgi:hypothetical protein
MELNRWNQWKTYDRRKLVHIQYKDEQARIDKSKKRAATKGQQKDTKWDDNNICNRMTNKLQRNDYNISLYYNDIHDEVIDVWDIIINMTVVVDVVSG